MNRKLISYILSIVLCSVSVFSQITTVTAADSAAAVSVTEPTGYMSDAEFFQKLDYTIDGLSAVKSAVDSGNYTTAKTELLNYYRARSKKSTYNFNASDKTLYVNRAQMQVDGYFSLQQNYYRGEALIGTEVKDYEVPLKGYSPSNGTVVFDIRAWYNEDSTATFGTKESNNPAKLVITVNGIDYTYEPAVDARLEYKGYNTTPYTDATGNELTARTYGTFLSTGNYKNLVMFTVSDLPSKITNASAKLVLHGSATVANKRIIVLSDAIRAISGKTFDDTFKGDADWSKNFVYSFNGDMSNSLKWTKIPRAYDEYLWQTSRFATMESVVYAYNNYNGQDGYYYDKGIFEIMADFIYHTGAWKITSPSDWSNGGSTRGGFPRILDASSKNLAFITGLEYLKDSEYLSPELFTAILKNIWDTGNYIYTQGNTTTENWRQSSYMALLKTAKYMPEFADSDTWASDASSKLEAHLLDNTLADGTYAESSSAYSVATIDGFASFRQNMIDNGVETTTDYDERLKKLAYYNANLYYPDGKGIAYGDSSSSFSMNAGTYAKICEWFELDDLRYMSTLGNLGTMPEFTSVHYPDSGVTFMRNGWDKNSAYLFTNVRYGGGHSHGDDNEIVLYALGRKLLTENGIFDYGASDQWSLWGKSSASHSTVTIDENWNGSAYTGVQNRPSDAMSGNTVNTIEMQDKFDYLSQTTVANEGVEHKRDILYLKSENLWFVTDTLTPDDASASKVYRQKWFLNNEGEPDNVAMTGNTVKTNFSEGANLTVTTLDADSTSLEDGKYDTSTATLEDSKYGQFAKTATGGATFNTLLSASLDDPDSVVVGEKFGDGDVKYEITRNDVTKTVYYFQNTTGTEASFANGAFRTDADVALVVLDSNENVDETVKLGGNYIYNANGAEISDNATGSNMQATEKDSKLTVFGMTDVANAGTNVTGMLLKKSADPETAASDDIGWFDMTTVDDGGMYRFEVPLKSGLVLPDYLVRVNLAGKPYTRNNISATDNGVLINATLTVEKSDDVIIGSAILKDAFNLGGLKYTWIWAFYDEDMRLIEARIEDEKSLVGTENKTISESIPQNTAFAKAMIWRGNAPISDLSDQPLDIDFGNTAE